jgi:WD40 repeat protein
LKGHDLRVTSVQFSPDGRRLLSIAGVTAMLWDPWKDPRYAEIGTVRDLLRCVAYSPDGQWIAYGGAGMLRDGQIDVILQRAATGEIAHRIPNVPVEHCEFSPDSQFLVVCSASHVDSEHRESRRAATLVDVATGLVQQRIEIPQTRILQARFASSDQLLLGCEDGSVRVWDMRSRQEQHSLPVAKSPIVSMALADGGRLLYARSSGAGTQIWDLTDRQGVQQLGGNASVLQLAASQDGRYVAVPTPNPFLGSDADPELLERRARGEAVEYLENHVDILDARTQKLFHRLAGHTKHVNCLAFTPDSRR